MRQFERFFSGLARFNLNTLSSDVHVFNAKLKELSNKAGINILSCSKTPLRRYINYTNNARFLLNPTKHTNSSIVQTTTPEALSQSTEIFPNLTVADNHHYSYTELTTVDSNLRLGKTVESGTFVIPQTTSITASIYSTLVLLTLFNTNRSTV